MYYYTCTMPDQFKIALITPLYKNAGYHNVDNYRGISVLPPIEKAFEKLIAKQILDYINTNNLLFKSQYGFRHYHSCESALHEILNYINENLSKKLIILMLFIDFRKAFDLVNTLIMLYKLE